MPKKTDLINNTAIVKKTNVELVRKQMREMKTATRGEIANATGLSVATSGNILKEMLNNNEVFEIGLQESNGGRPSRRFVYNKNFIQVASIGIFYDSSVKSVWYAVADSFGEIIEQKRDTYDMITYDIIDGIVKKIVETHSTVQALTISIPGKSFEGIIRFCDVKELENVALETKISQAYNIKVQVEGVTNVIALGYYQATPKYEGKSVAVLLAPENLYLGAGVIVNGVLIRGDQYMAGEVSFISGDIKREDALLCLSERDFFINSLTTSLTAIISVINPCKIIITGNAVTEDMDDIIHAKCREIIPEVFMPELEIIRNVDDYYLKGSISLSFSSTTRGLKIVEHNL